MIKAYLEKIDDTYIIKIKHRPDNSNTVNVFKANLVRIPRKHDMYALVITDKALHDVVNAINNIDDNMESD